MVATIQDISIMPSMAMLMMPERSAKMPEKAPRVMGTASITALESMPARFNDLPAACHTRKLKMTNRKHSPTRALVQRPKLLTSW